MNSITDYAFVSAKLTLKEIHSICTFDVETLTYVVNQASENWSVWRNFSLFVIDFCILLIGHRHIFYKKASVF